MTRHLYDAIYYELNDPLVGDVLGGWGMNSSLSEREEEEDNSLQY